MFNFSKGHGRFTMLLIDDDHVVREVIATLLTMAGHLVQTAEDGAKALKLLKDRTCAPGVILVDAQMPGLNGRELLDALRKSSPARIFLISGSRRSDELMHAADGFLLKPFRTAELEKLLHQDKAHPPAAATETTNHALPAELPVIGAETLRRLREMMPDTGVRKIYFGLVADLRRRMTALQRAIDDGNDADVRRIGHTIKGGCAVAGAERAARLGEQIEMGALDKAGNQPGNKSKFLQELDEAIHDLERMLVAEFPSLP